MAVVHGYDNQWLQALIKKRVRKLDSVAVVLVTSVICASLVIPVAGLVVLLAGVPVYLRQIRWWRYANDGAKGESETAMLLAGLPSTFTVFNDIAFGGYNVDHVVVGSSGVWVIETKSHRGVVTESADGVRVDGQPMYRDPRRQARGCAAEIAKVICKVTGVRHWVEAIVCFPRATVLTNGSPAATCVLSRQQLLARLRWGAGRLSPEQSRRICDALLAFKSEGAPESDRKETPCHRWESRTGSERTQVV